MKFKDHIIKCGPTGHTNAYQSKTKCRTDPKPTWIGSKADQNPKPKVWVLYDYPKGTNPRCAISSLNAKVLQQCPCVGNFRENLLFPALSLGTRALGQRPCAQIRVSLLFCPRRKGFGPTTLGQHPWAQKHDSCVWFGSLYPHVPGQFSWPWSNLVEANEMVPCQWTCIGSRFFANKWTLNPTLFTLWLLYFDLALPPFLLHYLHSLPNLLLALSKLLEALWGKGFGVRSLKRPPHNLL